jgi:hypothetical protein
MIKMVVDWFAIAIMGETAVFSLGIMYFISRMTRNIRNFSDEIRRSFQLWNIQRQVGEPNYPQEQAVEIPERISFPKTMMPMDVCDNCGLSLGEHTIEQGIQCGYDKLGNVKVRDVITPNRFISKRAREKKQK